MNLRDWIRKRPQPTKLRVDGKDVALVQGKNIWADALRTIEALKGTNLEAIAADGTVLRACTLDGTEDDDDDKGKPGASKVVSELAALAGIVATAYKDAFALAQTSMDNANAKLVEVAASATNRATALEAVWQQTLADRAKEVEERIASQKTGDDDEEIEGLVKAMVAGKLSPASNGAAAGAVAEAVASAAAKQATAKPKKGK